MPAPLPPNPDRWTKGVLTLFPSGGDKEGTLQLGCEFSVAGWGQSAGVATFRWRHGADDWAPGVVTLARGDDGFDGTMSLGSQVIHIRGWHRVSSHYEFDFQHASDAEMEDIEAQLTGKVGG